MPGTGIHGYTGPALYGGSYNISNGIVTSGSPGTAKTTSGGHVIASKNSPYGEHSAVNDPFTIGASGNDVVSPTSQMLTQQIVNSMPDYSPVLDNLASTIAKTIGTSQSEYADTIRQLMKISEQNTAKSQQMAREQMAYQTKSDQAAMAWSAQEAQKNRDWQERLSNNAHRREVKDLMAAGLNPILSANAGAYTGSGATGQGFSSSGAMGSVDTSITGALGSLYDTVMNTAAQAQVAGMYVDAERYAADLQYSSSKMATEASILNNQTTNNANKEMAANALRADLQKANISAAASRYSADKNLAAAGTSAAAMRYSADQSAAANRYSADMNYKGKELDAETQKWLSKNDPLKNPAQGIVNSVETATDWFEDYTGLKIPRSIPEALEQRQINSYGASHRF